MTTDKASVAMLEALRDELRTASTEPVAGLSQRLDEVSARLDVNAQEHAGVFSPSVAPEPEYGPRPFEVRWDPTLDDGDGGWAVYLPTEHLLAYDGVEVATSDISGLTVVQDVDGNDTSWYSLDDVGEDTEHVWLVLTVPDSGPVEAEFAEEERQAASGERVVNVCVAEIDRSMSDAAGNPVPAVRQSLVGALHLGSGGGGGVTPDDASLDWNAGGKAQIKDWDNGAPTDPNSLAAYLQGAVQPPANGLQVVARAPQQGGAPALGYVPLGALDLSEYAKKADIVEFLHPFEVKWSPLANQGAGAWVIWLPDTTKLVHVGNAYISPILNIVAEAALPAGWYRATTVTATSTAVWLNITTYTATGQIWLDISNSAGQSATGFACVPLLIATMTRDTQTGSWSVKQFIDSTITFGGSSGGGGGGLTGTVEFVADVDWYVNGSVHQLRKRLRVLDLATGNVTDKAKTTYANGWEVAANTTPISSIIGS